VAVDETNIKLEGRWQYLWAAIDVDSWEILAVRITRSRSSLDTLIFMREVLKTCENKPKVYVDAVMVPMGPR